MKKSFYITLVALGLALSSCFKDTVEYTRFNLSVQEQNQKDGEYYPSDDVEAYAYYADTAVWSIDSYEAALERRLTNKKSGQTLSKPDVEAQAVADEKYPLMLELRQEKCLMVVVDPVHRIYATRYYLKPENLADVYARLYIATWRQSMNSSGWRVVNQFYEAEKTE
ncbi:MAG: hypothetical protein IKZ11_04510 [Alistipes sp.]|nr:hypothetical protein [Alistipes sp.]